MLSWALTFLVVALIAGVLGFGVVAGTAASIAQVLFFLFLVLFVVSLIFGRTPRTHRLTAVPVHPFRLRHRHRRHPAGPRQAAHGPSRS